MAEPPIGAAWLAAHGRGRLQPEDKEALRSELSKELLAKVPQGGAGQIQDELDRFFANGRVSDTNLSRLYRRVVGGSGSLSARGDDARSIVSEFSLGTNGGSYSARGPASHSRNEELLPALPEEGGNSFVGLAEEDSLLGGLCKWSQVAKYSRVLEEKEKVQKRVERHKMQEQLRNDLQKQVDEKEYRKLSEKVWEKKIYEQQEADLQRWKDQQKQKEEDARKKVLKVKRDREQQNEQNEQRREHERMLKLEEDRRAVQRAHKELDEEKAMLHTRKMANMKKQMQVVEEWKKERAVKESGKHLQYEEERKKIAEYRQMLEEQEARNKQSLPEPRGCSELGGLPKGRRGDEVYTEEFLMRQQQAANQQAEEAEKRKRSRLKNERESNQDFLFKQMEAKISLKDQMKEAKAAQKQTVQAATAEYVKQERRSAEEARMKNVRYRLELEQQITDKKNALKSTVQEDEMSGAERSINRRLLEDAARSCGVP